MPRKFCWRVFVDVLVLEDGGNLVDTACVAALAALRDARLPQLRLFRGEAAGDWELELDDDAGAFARLPQLDALPLAITFTQLGRCSVVDALPEEEACADSRVLVAVTRAGSVVAARSSGRAGVEHDSLLACLQAAERIAPALFAQVDGATLSGDEAAAAAASGAKGAAPRRRAPGTALLRGIAR